MTKALGFDIIFEHLRIHSSLAQSVEHAAVNRRVVGSSPTGGASREPRHAIRVRGFLFLLNFYARDKATSVL